MDRFEEMRVFAAVVDAGSFVGAADALQRSKASVSRHVAELEARLGVRLLHRTTRRLSLTDEGEVFHARCATLLAGLDEAEAEISSRSGEAIGLLRVNVPVSYGLLRLAPLWAGFLAAHPKVRLDVTLSDRVVDLVEEGYDLAVRIGRLADSSLVSRRLGSTALVLCASPGYLVRHGAPGHPSELAAHQVVAYSLLSTGDTWTFEGEGDTATVEVQPRMRTNSGDTCRAVAVGDEGIVLQPEFIVRDDLARGALRELLPRWRAPSIDVHAVYPSRRHVAPKVRLLIDWLAAHLREPDASRSRRRRRTR
jgi:DNA-binding transcriptional LysR family regulator